MRAYIRYPLVRYRLACALAKLAIRTGPEGAFNTFENWRRSFTDKQPAFANYAKKRGS